MNRVTMLFTVGFILAGCSRSDGDTQRDKPNMIIDVVHTYQMVLDDIKTRDNDPIMEVRKYGKFNELDSMDVRLFDIKNKDTEYLIIQTGDQRDLLDGGGHYYCYMLVNGQWIFHSRISWVS
jgi:hypothetical protein